jgi:hypothetical protein
MGIVVVGSADRNKTVGEIMGDRAKTGAEFLDLAAGNLVKIVSEPTETVEPTEKPKRKSKVVK